jgi:hypothetical protein
MAAAERLTAHARVAESTSSGVACPPGSALGEEGEEDDEAEGTEEGSSSHGGGGGVRAIRRKVFRQELLAEYRIRLLAGFKRCAGRGAKQWLWLRLHAGFLGRAPAQPVLGSRSAAEQGTRTHSVQGLHRQACKNQPTNGPRGCQSEARSLPL